MCIYPTYIINPKYKPNKKNHGIVPIPRDSRLLYVPIPCGKCYECRRKKRNEWLNRINEEVSYSNKNNIYMKFVTLTFSEENLSKLDKRCGTDAEANSVAKISIYLFRERWRKRFKYSCKHFIVPELGHQNTERLHLHGILFLQHNATDKEISEIWQYGRVQVGKFVNEASVKYITKYMLKTDERGFEGRIFASPGLGKSYLNKIQAKNARYKRGETQEWMIAASGRRTSLPTYYRNEIYTEHERENLWLERLDKEERWVDGVKYPVNTEAGIRAYEDALNVAREKNKKLQYGRPLTTAERIKNEGNLGNRKIKPIFGVRKKKGGATM